MSTIVDKIRKRKMFSANRFEISRCRRIRFRIKCYSTTRSKVWKKYLDEKNKIEILYLYSTAQGWRYKFSFLSKKLKISLKASSISLKHKA